MSSMVLSIAAISLPDQPFRKKNIALVDLRYPYGKPKVYMSGSLSSVAARLLSIGHSVEFVDLNLESLSNARVLKVLGASDLIGVSVIGSPGVPGAINFARKMKKLFAHKFVMFGGQVIKSLERDQFNLMFRGTNAVQIVDDNDLAVQLQCRPEQLPPPFSVPFQPAWEALGADAFARYIENEFTLVVSQGCKYRCDYCGAAKGQREQHVSAANFASDMHFLFGFAASRGLKSLECYATPLDFFQNPAQIVPLLEILAELRAESGIDLKMRCLSCTSSLIEAQRKVPGLGQLCKRAGLWCIGFGVDGTDEQIWKAQHKWQNNAHDVTACLDFCRQFGIRAEILMVMGYRQDTLATLWKDVKSSVRYAWRWPDTMLRPYLSKEFIPGNEGWQLELERAAETVANPRKFFNLDFCALGSRLTHPRMLHRWMCNAAYLAIISLLTPFGRCCTSPLLPQGEAGVGGSTAKLINRMMPFDR